jgi:hypothetical protein
MGFKEISMPENSSKTGVGKRRSHSSFGSNQLEIRHWTWRPERVSVRG